MWQKWSYERIEEFNIPDAQRIGFDTTAHPFLFLVGGISIAFASLMFEKIQLAINANEITSDVGDLSPIHQGKEKATKDVNPNTTEGNFSTSRCQTCQSR